MMRQQPRKQSRSAGCATIVLLCVVITFWYLFYLSGSTRQAKAPADDFTGHKVASDLLVNSSNAILIRLDDEKTLV